MNRATPSQRFRFHWPSWVTMIVLLWFMGLLTLSGIEDSGNENERQVGRDIVQSFGWPFEFQRSKYLDWVNIRPIALFGEVYSFSLLALAVDLAVLFAVVGLGGWMTERHWRRRRWSVSIFELLVTCTVIAVIFGWYQMHRQPRNNEARAIQTLEDLGDNVLFDSLTFANKPQWLERTLGFQRSLPFFNFVGEVTLHCNSETADEALSALANFREARVLKVNRHLVCQEFVELVSAMPHLHHLRLDYNSEAPSEPSASSGSFIAPHSHYLTPSQLEKSMAQIKTDLNLFSQLDRLDSLETLNLIFPRIELSTWKKFPPLTKLTELSLSGDLLIDDLTKLKQYPSLKVVYADVLATNWELEDFQCRHPQLKLWYGRSLTPMAVAWRRLERVSGSQAFNLNQFYIELAGVPINETTLALLDDVNFEEVETLEASSVASPAALAKLLLRCPILEQLDLSKLEFSKAEIDQLNLSKLEWLTIGHGTLNVSDFVDLVKRVQPNTLTITNAHFSAEEIAELENVWPDAYFDNMAVDEEDMRFKALGNQDLLLRKPTIVEIDF